MGSQENSVMNFSDDISGFAREAEKEARKKQRKEKWAKREKSFWKAFLFTKDGKPKSGLLIYTFCLSFLFIGLYILMFSCFIDWLTPALESFSPVLSNLAVSAAVSAVGILAGALLHRFLRDKRLFFGTCLWLTVYLAAVLVTMLLMLRGTGGIEAFLYFFLWFMVIPVLSGLLVSFLLFRKDYRPETQQTEPEPWKKYTQRR